MRDPKAKCEWIFGQPMNPCPKCGGYDLMYQTPIQLSEPVGDTPRDIVRAWARATRAGRTPLEGPVYLMCRTCGHHGPALDCSGRTQEDVGRDPAVAREVKRLWNEQPREEVPRA